MKTNRKQRLTAFISPELVIRAKIRGALEDLTISEIVEKALDAYAPKIVDAGSKRVHLNFISAPKTQILMPKHTKHIGVPR